MIQINWLNVTTLYTTQECEKHCDFTAEGLQFHESDISNQSSVADANIHACVNITAVTTCSDLGLSPVNLKANSKFYEVISLE